MRHRTRALAIALGVIFAIPALAAEEISTDITVDLAGTLATDEDVVEDAAGVVTKIDLGTLPSAADVTGYSIAPGGDILFALDIAASLPGGVDVTPRDVVRWNGSLYSVELRGTDHSIPAGAAIDAIGWIEGDLLLSFDVTVDLGSVTADDEDLVQLASTLPDDWVLYFDGSAEGVPAGADLDGADLLDANGHLALSFDISGSVGGVAFDDEDILEFVPGPDTWSKRYDGATAHPALAAADVDAVFAPEPGAAALGLLALATFAAIRVRRTLGVSKRLLAVGLLALALADPALATDGRLEINQACVAAGCFAGDAPGLPVETQVNASYVLTSNLTIGAFTGGVTLGAGSTLDLNGFAIEGNAICTGTPAACSQGLSGGGVIAGERATVRNGTIRGVRSFGIHGDDFVRVQNMRIEHNSLDGINGSDGPLGWLIEDCHILQNGANGIALNYAGGAIGGRVLRNTIYGSHSAGLLGGIALLQDNTITSNGGLGAALNYSDTAAGFSGNQLWNNNSGNANPQMSGGVSIGINICGTDTTCP